MESRTLASSSLGAGIDDNEVACGDIDVPVDEDTACRVNTTLLRSRELLKPVFFARLEASFAAHVQQPLWRQSGGNQCQ